MKHMRKLVTLVVVLAMVMAFMVPTAMAATVGTITIEGAVNGQIYTAYKVFDVTYNADKTSYNYSIDSSSAFYDVISTFATNENGMQLIQVGTTTTYNVKVDTAVFTADKAAALATALNNDTSKPTAAGSRTAASNTASIEVAELGYYFVDSTLGSLCALDTTNSNVTVYEKNALPSLTKSVQEGDGYGTTASASIGQAVNFKLVVNTGTNTHSSASGVDANYVITDTLPNGMDYIGITSVKGNGTVWSNDDYSVNTSGKVITLTLNAASVQALGQNKDIEIIYTAKLNANATIAGAGNVNTATLAYNNYTTATASTTVYTYALALEKYNSAGNNLANAKFSFPFTASQIQAGSDTTPAIYKISDASTGTTEITTPASGNIVVIGLDIGSYTITETAAPEGYNKLETGVTIPVEAINGSTVNKTFTDSSSSVTFTAGTDDGSYSIAANSIIGIKNQSGTELPSTGGMGTTIFYILGGLMVVGAAVVLVTNKRMRGQM